ncbi:MAG: LamB/YcsF family protein [Chitinophagaceae bacterium]|nr:LamB/YcsF family protein [Chitinophagaceae bacterium]
MRLIDINCDMGEGLQNDEALMHYITSANIACGYHAGDAVIMERTVELALKYEVAVGAHPGFNDKENFGRTEMKLPLNEIYDLVVDQVMALQQIAKKNGTALRHVKPHGALYNMSAKDPLIANTIAKAVYAIDPQLVLFGLSGSHSISEAQRSGLKTASEVFADRSYQDDGSLTPRSHLNAMIGSTEQSLQQVLQMVCEHTVCSVSGLQVPIIAETICIHGDGEHALAFAEAIFQTLQKHQIGIIKE